MNYWMIGMLIFGILLVISPFIFEFVNPMFTVILGIVLIILVPLLLYYKSDPYAEYNKRIENDLKDYIKVAELNDEYRNNLKNNNILVIFKNIDNLEYLKDISNKLEINNNIVEKIEDKKLEKNVNELLILKYQYLNNMDKTLNLKNIILNARLENKLIAKNIIDLVEKQNEKPKSTITPNSLDLGLGFIWGFATSKLLN